MHLTQTYLSARGIKQIPLSLKINHHGHSPCCCWRNCGVRLINQCTLYEILDELYLRPLASSILKDALTFVNASSIHTRGMVESFTQVYQKPHHRKMLAEKLYIRKNILENLPACEHWLAVFLLRIPFLVHVISDERTKDLPAAAIN